MATNGNTEAQFTAAAAPSTTSATSKAAADPSSDSNLGKDEVAWFFVEQYYTTLSKTPEKLHLFYGKRSQFVVGREAEVANVSVGRQSIQERLKQLDLQDCKVRVSNVDSQTSFDNIVIQVIGETSNKAGNPKKFVQTFVLAQQPSGYFVLNDLLRYIDDEADDETAETAEEEDAATEATPAPAAQVEEPEAPASVKEAAAPSLDAEVVEKKLEEVSAKPESVNGDAAPEPVAESAPVEVPNPEAIQEELVAEEVKEPEKPADPSPTPVQSRQPAAPAAPAPTGPPKPMTWASRAAAAATPRPVIPLPKTATPPAQARPAAAQAAAPTPAATTAASIAEEPATSAPAKESSEWQTAGSDSKRQGKPQTATGTPTEKEGTMGYVKYVTDKVKHDDLKQALAQHGEVVYFDINRQKNCAFVEFATVAGYQAAVAANPHVINGESIQVEPRRPKAGAYGGSNYASGGRGGAPSRGGRGGGFEGGRQGSSGGRGNFGGQNRGRGGARGAWGTA